MQKNAKKCTNTILIVLVLFTSLAVNAFGKKTFFGIRSQGLKGERELAGWQQCMFKYDQHRNFGAIAAIAEYDRSFRSDKIANFLFGNQSVRFRGSRSPDRQDGDIMADYFGLPIDFASNISFSPVISSFIVDFNLFQAFDATVPGLFCMFHIPVVHTVWGLEAKEAIVTPSTEPYPAGYLSNSPISSSDLPQSVMQALQGATVFGDMQEPLVYGKVNGRQKRSRVAELQATVGWNYNAEKYHAGVSMRIGAPTGNIPNAEFLFEDIVGNRHHWDIGFGLSGHIDAWYDKNSGRKIAFYADGHFSHLCASGQKRSFDLTNNGPGSRYILLEKVDYEPSSLLISGKSAEYHYAQELAPAINYTTFDTKISIAVQADVVIKFAYQRDGFECDLGYNLWANSKEKIHSRCTLPANRFALKGDAQLYGFSFADNSVTVPVNATQSMATIFGGQGAGNGNFQNLNADNQPAPASFLDGLAVPLVQLNNDDSIALGISQVQIQGSNPARLLTDADINQESGTLPRALSSKFFLFVNNKWDNRDDVDPYAGLGVSVEVAHTNSCSNSACSQWSLWFKTGFSY